ncbi:adenylate cyclase [Actinomadura sp. NBRC 104412]|uniref:adenylate/guanylate cyclase domain-containing protein n=1 Tax=Actinomadura sp. NBRC 104412 TaxID=3032203 RepID=UPI0024A0AB3A|nr:adenylate/guanylate cyclase domain-containing protein [Actinomadura sp. NBRC 104412]GLZ08866.1 adenylate cyclase [Actinomadura sp. NBRC 104412]
MTGRAMARGIGARLDVLGKPRSRLELRVRWVLFVVVVVANVGGGAVVLLFATFVVPDPPLADVARVRQVNTVAFFSYPLVAGPVALLLGLRLWRPVVRLARMGGVPDETQRRAVLLGPFRLALLVGGLWVVGAAGWAVLDLLMFSARLAVKTGLTCLLGAMTTCTIVYLLSEWVLRPAASLVLASGQPNGRPRGIMLPGVTTRVMLAWALGTAIPVFGLICVAVAALVAPGIDTTQLAVTILGLGGAALIVGLQVTYMATRAIADPIKSVRKGMSRVQRGDLRAEVPVYDAGEVGRLQVGFNHMVAGLREHERLRDLFGRHVGEEVAGLAIERGDIELGGETREVAVLFVDLTGSTRLAETRAPDEVVGLLNRFFGVVVDVVAAHGGWINKFEGDAALAIFGAPAEMDDAAGSALGAARELARRLRVEVPQLDAGIGVSAGPVVAGYIGAERRFEYTVIGDPVNEAARLSDLAKVSPGRVLASGTVHERAHAGEAAAWVVGRPVALRGRRRPTHLVTPRPTTVAETVGVSPPVVYGVPEAAVSAARRLRLPRRPRIRRPRLIPPSIPVPRIIRSAREATPPPEVDAAADAEVQR